MSRNRFFFLICIPLSCKTLHHWSPSSPRGRAVQGATFPVVDWCGVGSNPTGDIYFHFGFFAPSRFRTGQRSFWNQARPFTWSHSWFRPQIQLIIQGFVYSYLQYSFKLFMHGILECVQKVCSERIINESKSWLWMSYRESWKRHEHFKEVHL